MVADYPVGSIAILVMSGPHQGERIPLERPVLLGRDPRSRITFDDERVSRHHALIDVADNVLVIRDLGSKNGTFVNGTEIKDAHVLRPNDRIRIGKTQLAVVALAYDEVASNTPPGMETSADHPSPTMDSDGALQVSRRILRQAAELTNRLAGLCRTRHPVFAVLSAIRREFRADGAGLLLAAPPFEPICLEGDLVLTDATLRQLREQTTRPDFQTPVFLRDTATPPQETLLILPLRHRDELMALVVLRRQSTRPFEDEQLGLADCLSECVKTLPIPDLLADSRKALPDALAMIIGSSDVMEAVRQQVRTYAAADATVLIVGESGTGKELTARAIAQLSERRFGPYVEVNSACMTPELIESELFGHERGAFTGATERRMGKLELADGGILFLDEIGELPIDLQAKLLRVLEGQPFYRLGGKELIRTDVRFLCATNRNLEEMVAKGLFRRDLYHRINILRFDLPPLRNHLEDLPELVRHLMGEVQEDLGERREFTLSPKAYRRLLAHAWPGNVRELRNVLQRMMLLSPTSLIDEKQVPQEVGTEERDSTTMKLPRLQVLTEMMEREEISRALSEAGGQKSTAARLLGISRPTLDKKIKFYGLAALCRRGGEKDDEEEGLPTLDQSESQSD